jgi:osmotically-inducible protein OsmY
MFKKGLLCVVLMFGLSACVPIIVGGAVAATVYVVHDSRTPADRKVDAHIQEAIQDKLNAISDVKTRCHIVVSVFHGNVLLAGQAPTDDLRAQIQKAVSDVAGIVRLYNEIQIEAPNSKLTRMSDSWISTKVRYKIKRDKTLQDPAVQLITENGTVYLMGQVQPGDADKIAVLASKVSGVQQVVKVSL